MEQDTQGVTLHCAVNLAEQPDETRREYLWSALGHLHNLVCSIALIIIRYYQPLRSARDVHTVFYHKAFLQIKSNAN